MSVTYGYDLKDGDKILEPAVQIAKMLSRLIRPGAALVNYLPICAVSNFIAAILMVLNGYFQYDIFLHGSRTLAMNHWRKLVGR